MHKTIKTEVLYRDFALDRGGIDEKARLVPLSFSSDKPYKRWFGNEVLDHASSSVDMTRLGSGNANLLVNHNTDDVVGVVEKAWVEGSRGKAVVRFGKSARAEEVFKDVVDGIRSSVSVGYIVNKMEHTGTSDDGLDNYRVVDWIPLEISLVSVPADASVGIGRANLEKKYDTVVVKNKRNITMNEPTQLTKNSILEIQALGRTFNMEKEAQKAIEDDLAVDAFRKNCLEEIHRRQKKNQPPDFRAQDNLGQDNIGMSSREINNYSIIRAAEAAASGNWESAGYELEIHKHIRQAMGPVKASHSFYVPMDIFRRDIATSGSGSNLVSNQFMGDRFIDVLRNASRVMEAGATVLNGLTGDADIPRHTAATTGYWVGEGSDITESTPTYDQVQLAFKTVGGLVDITRKQRIQANLDMENLVKRDLGATLATALDLGAINGSGSSGQPTGILNTSGIGSVTFTTTGQPTFAEVIDVETEISTDNALDGRLAYMCNAALYGQLKKTEKTSSTGIFVLEDGKMNGYPVLMTNQVPTNTLLFGNFLDLLIGIFGPGLEFNADTATLSASGGLRLVAFLSCDIGVRHPESFAEGA